MGSAEEGVKQSLETAGSREPVVVRKRSKKLKSQKGPYSRKLLRIAKVVFWTLLQTRVGVE